MNTQDMKRNIFGGLITGIILSFDIVTKYYIEKFLSDGRIYDYMGGFLKIVLVYNTGGVFGIAQGHKNVFMIISIIVLILMIFYYIYENNKSLPFTVAMSLIFAGAIGNIIDRLIPDRKGVVDFISIGVDHVFRWPAFNVADSAIVVGAFLLIYVFYIEEKKRKETEKQSTGTN